MPGVKFLALLNGTLSRCGLPPARVSQELADAFADWLTERVGRAWIVSIWPETTNLEQRFYAPTWSGTGTYASGNPVWHAATLAYWQANASTTGADVPGASAKWVAYTPNKWIPFAQTGLATISEPLNAWKDDPRAVRGPREIGFFHDGVTVFLDPQCGSAWAWLKFRRAAPKFSATAYDATAVYHADDCFLWTDGNAYLVLATTTAGETPQSQAAKFAVQQCPAVLKEYGMRGTKADWLDDDGQSDKAAAAETMAAGWLAERLADLSILQGQTSNYRGG